jgi:acyl-CoA synthetase (NDP forming)
MTSSGAGASLMADKASEYGLDLADISEKAKARIPERRSAILTNPFDTRAHREVRAFFPPSAKPLRPIPPTIAS